MAVRKFRIVVDGVTHEVEVEELNNSEATEVSRPAATVPSSPAAPAAAPAQTSAAPAAGGNDITAPLQGTVLSVNVKAGDSLKAGDLVAVIEAMKMENEIVAPRDGIVASVTAKEGNKVATGDILVTLK